MRIRMKIHITGYRNGVPWPPRGREIDLPDHEAQQMVAQGYAELAPDDHDDGVGAPTGKVADVLAWVGDDPERARAALELEQAEDKPRVTLVAALEAVSHPED